MLITYLGHAGFYVETSASIIVMDPWLSPSGAFDSAWFQYPCNHNMAALVQEKLQDSSKDRYIYISHEHKDHLDLEFLNSLVVRDFKFIVPRFCHSNLYKLLSHYHCKGIITCSDSQKISLKDGYIQIYLEDFGINRDSAILVCSDGYSFLNMNDCKLHDQLTRLKREKGDIDIFTCQFSGATWHPTCYNYSQEVYQKISQKKMISKFEATAQAIEAVRPKMYLPSAGPPCFLDPLLFHINFEPVNIFPRAPKLLTYLKERLEKSYQVYAPEIMPGDVINVATCDFAYKTSERASEDKFNEYIQSYASKYEEFFRARHSHYSPEQIDSVYSDLRLALAYKLSLFTLNKRIERPLYIQFQDAPQKILCVNFQGQTVEETSEIPGSNYYLLTSPSWQIAHVLKGKLTWEDFALTFRMHLSREPDNYETLIQGFLIIEAEDLPHFCTNLKNIESNAERIIIDAGDCRYSIDRLCPHQGGELSEGWIEEGRFLVCSRHRWRFDLQNHGRCETSRESINALVLEEG